jgi:hypothetical protein
MERAPPLVHARREIERWPRCKTCFARPAKVKGLADDRSMDEHDDHNHKACMVGRASMHGYTRSTAIGRDGIHRPLNSHPNYYSDPSEVNTMDRPRIHDPSAESLSSRRMHVELFRLTHRSIHRSAGQASGAACML